MDGWFISYCYSKQNMIVRSSKKNILIDKQQIINYEYQILEQPTPLAKPTISNTDKYALWDLDSKIQAVVGDQSYSVRWIGNSQTAYLETYAYILLIGTGYSQTNIVQFKYNIYKLGRECLDLREQKLLVQFLCLIQYSRDRYSFLNKYPQIEAIFIKILQFVEDQQPRSEDSTPLLKKKAKVRRKTATRNIDRVIQKQIRRQGDESNHSGTMSQSTDYEMELQQIYKGFNKHFEFISILGSNEYCCTLKLFNNKKVYVVIEKQCYFMVEIVEKVYDPSIQFTLGDRNGNISDLQRIVGRDGKQTEKVQSFDEKINFNQDQFQVILQYKNQVQESNVVPVERGSQIRKRTSRELGGTPKFSSGDLFSNNFRQRQQEWKHIEDIPDHEKTFIDELLGNVTISNDADNKQYKTSYVFNKINQPLTKKQKIMQTMKEIKSMKQALQGVRQRIQHKIKKIDQVQNMKTQAIQKQHERFQAQRVSNKSPSFNRQYMAYNQNRTLNIKMNKDHQRYQRQRKTSYNAPVSLPSVGDQGELDELVNNNRFSGELKSNALQHAFSSKQHSRPQSMLRQADQSKLYGMSFSPVISNRKGSLDVTLLRPVPPNNLNVNVNVSINENIVNPAYRSPQNSYCSAMNKDIKRVGMLTSKMKPYPSQYFVPPHLKSPQSCKYLFPLNGQQKPCKISNPQRSFISITNKGITSFPK